MKPSGRVENAPGLSEKIESLQNVEFFLLYVVDIVRTVKGDLEKVLRANLLL